MDIETSYFMYKRSPENKARIIENFVSQMRTRLGE